MEHNTHAIRVLGSGCPTCKKLYERTNQALKNLGSREPVEYITDIQEILRLGLMQSPVLVINDKPVLVGSLPSVVELQKIIAPYLRA